MVSSIHTNTSALIALEGLNSIGKQLDNVTKQVNTGYKVNDALDDGAAFAVAQGLRSDLSAIDAVTGQLQSAKGLIQVANSAGTNVSNDFQSLQSVLTKLSDADLSAAARSDYAAQYTSIVAEISGYISSATFNGQNLLNSTTAVNIISNTSGATIVVTSFDLNSQVVTNLGSAPTSASAAVALLTGGFVTAQSNIATALASYGTANTRISNQISYLGAVSDATTEGLGSIVDADLAKQSAKLQSLQTQQQLATQTLSIANQQSSIILNLFK